MAVPSYNFGLTVRYPAGHAQEGQPYSGCSNVQIYSGEAIISLEEFGTTAFYFASNVPAGRWSLWINGVSSGQSFAVGAGELAGRGYEDGKILKSKTDRLGWENATSQTWETLPGKPVVFPPSGHAHSMNDVSGLPGVLNGKSDVGHSHAISEVDLLPSTLDGINTAIGQRALDTNVVHKAGVETIAGKKQIDGGFDINSSITYKATGVYDIGSETFRPHYIYSDKLYTTDISIGGNPISAYVDGRLADSTGIVHTAGNEDIDGIKTFKKNVKIAGSNASLDFVPPSDSGDGSKQAVRFNTSTGALKSFVGYGAGSVGEYLRAVIVGPLVIATPKIILGTIPNGDAAGGDGTLAFGSWGGAYCGIWAGGLDPSATNEGIRLGASATLINSPGVADNVHVRHGETRKNVVFNADPIANATTQSDVRAVTMGGYINSGWSIWPGNVSALSSNYAFYCSAGTGEINGGTHSLMSVAGVGVVDATASAVTITLSGSAQLTVGTNFALFANTPVMPGTTTGLSTGNISWDMDAYKNLTTTGALTGNITVNMSNNRSGRSTLFSFTNGSTSRQVGFSCLGVTFRFSGRVGTSSSLFSIPSTELIANACYVVRFEWLTATICSVIIEKA